MNKCIIFISLFIISGCRTYKYTEVKLENENPTFYIYNSQIEEVRTKIREKWETVCYKKIEFAEDEHVAWGKEILSKPENCKDVYVYAYGWDTSYIYINKEYPIYYYAEYHVHMLPINENSTKIEIYTIKPKILLKEPRYPSFFNFAAESRTVMPSTIEEYKILLCIGEILGVKDQMPKLYLPEHQENRFKPK